MPLGDVIVTAPATFGVAFRRHVIELALAVVFLLVGISWIVNPDLTAIRSPIGRNLGGFAWAWSILYLAGCPMIISGILRRMNNVRIAGLLLLTAGLVMQGTAAVFASNVEPRSFAYYVYATAAAFRAFYLVRVAERR